MKCTICDKEMSGLVCNNKWCREIHVECSTCGKVLNQSDAYDYRGFIFCNEHFDDGQIKVDDKRQEIIEVQDKMVRSQADGEWANGGYKTMKVGHDGKPITKIKEPKIVEDYENGIL